MYFGYLGLIIGIVLGVIRATKAGGNRLDKLQYGAAHGIIFGLLGLAFALVLGWIL